MAVARLDGIAMFDFDIIAITTQARGAADEAATDVHARLAELLAVPVDEQSTTPLAILATFSFLSALLAISAVLPRVGKAPPAARDGEDRGNLLFFGHFAQMGEDEFIAAIKARLRTEEDLYEVMLRDTWQNGVVLARRKYRYLAYAYRLFVVGLTLTFLAFAVEMTAMWME